MRYSLTTFLFAVAIISMIVAGLAYPSLYWTQIIATTTFASLLTATAVALAWQRKTRWFWIGFSVFGWGYLALAFYGDNGVRNMLLTHSAVVQLDKMLETSIPKASPSGEVFWLRHGMVSVYADRYTHRFKQLSIEEAAKRGVLKHAYTESTIPKSQNYFDIAHYGCTILLGCIGGMLSLALYRRSSVANT